MEPQSSGIEASPQWTKLEDGKGAGNGYLVGDGAAAVDQTWWSRFRDPTLDTLVAEALANNKSLAIARARVEEARAGRLLAQSALAPQVNATASSERGNRGFVTNDQAVTINQVAISAAWEVDLFGRNQARTAQAAAVLQSAEASQQAVRVALLAEVARTYFELRNFAQQIGITERNLDSQRRTLQLIQAQMQGALASNFDVRRAAAQVSSTESLLPTLRTGHDGAMNRLSSLLGRTPGDYRRCWPASRPGSRSIRASWCLHPPRYWPRGPMCAWRSGSSPPASRRAGLRWRSCFPISP